jgi:hypothetical protein
MNPAGELQSHKVKSLSTYYTSPVDNEERLIFKKDFNTKGKVINVYQLSLWEAVSYSYTTTYQYNDLGQLITKSKVQKFLNLFDRDEDYLHFFGDKPLNEQQLYHYNEQGDIRKKLIFTFGEEKPDQQAQPSQSIYYEYEQNKLISEESSSSDDKFFNRNYLIKYTYDSVDNLIQKSMDYGKELELHRNFIYKYNIENQLIEEQVIDFSIPHNNIHLRYEYNEDGRKSKKLIYNEEEKVFEEETIYEYDEKGNVISGDREVKYEYHSNGLIKSESWTDPTSSEQIILTTQYDYY